MGKLVPLVVAGALLLAPLGTAFAQCSTTNAASCNCRDGSQDCDLLPDITISWDALQHYLNGPLEYSQTGNGVDNGRLKITGSTPNIGFGSFTVRGSNWFVCGTDTFQYTTGTPPPCASGAMPHQLLYQRVYHKNGATMTFSDRFAGAMTYHPTHGHNHVDDWSIFTLRLRDSTKADPREWPIVGTGAKVGFCLMDYYPCTSPNAAGHCRTDNTLYQGGTPLNTAAAFPNYGLGGGQYNCSPIEQGISSGYTDVYSRNLDGMWINIPPGTCNGEYWVVMEVDPHNYFLEENETNNFTAAPVLLTQQNPAGTGVATIRSDRGTVLCPGESLQLTATPGFRYQWSTGDSTQTIAVNQPGTYTVMVDNHCGQNTSAPFVVTASTAPPAPLAVQGDTVCVGQPATLTATSPGTGTLTWFDAAGAPVGQGATFTTPPVTGPTTYYVRNVNMVLDSTRTQPASNAFGAGGYLSATQGLVFNADVPFVLESCLIYANSVGPRTIELRNDYGLTVATRTVNLTQTGAQRITLNLPVTAGTGWQLLGISANSQSPNLYRNNAGVQFPYTVPGVLSITGSSAGAQYYYYFYDWKVTTTLSDCGSIGLAVPVTIGTPRVSMSGLPNDTLLLSAVPVPLVGTPAGGTFSGPGVVNNTFYPTIAGVGGPYQLTYTYAGPQGCAGQATQPVTVVQPTGVADATRQGQLAVTPNPTRDRFRVTLPARAVTAGSLQLVDLLGRVVVQRSLTPGATVAEEVSVAGLPAGTYLLRVLVDGARFVRPVVVQ